MALLSPILTFFKILVPIISTDGVVVADFDVFNISVPIFATDGC